MQKRQVSIPRLVAKARVYASLQYKPSYIPWQRNTDDDSDSANTVAHTFLFFLVLLRCLVRATGLSYQLLEELWCAVHEGCAANSKVYAARHLQSGEPTYWL